MEAVGQRRIAPPKVRTVFSPGIPDEDLRLLRNNPGKQIPASAPIPEKRPALRGVSRAGLALTFVSLVLFLVAYPDIVWSNPGYMVAGIVCSINFLGGTLMLAGTVGEGDHSRAARIHHGRYLCAADFDQPASALLRRAQTAIEGIAVSQAAEEGMIGGLSLLRRYEWDLARLLHRQTRTRAERPDDPDLTRSVGAALRRVEHLEEYHRRVTTLYAVYQAKENLDDLAEAIDLLPRESDTRALETLAWHAAQVESMIRTDLREAARQDPQD